ncbi:MAG: hypothetical protein IKF17_03945 [Clostridia bacterium]|nr:hypothetical protein [Clostridia bacterium]
MSEYKKNKNWNMFVEENKLFIAKGADEIYFLDDINEEDANNIYKAYSDDMFENIDENVLKKLEKVGVIYKNILKTPTNELKICIKYYGTNTEDIHNCIMNYISKKSDITVTDKLENCDLLLMIRTNSQLKDVLQDYDKIDVPHLFVDIAYANTISIGPLVYKSDTACLGCYIGRLAKHWGDMVPPEEPQVIKKHDLIALLTIERIDEFLNLGNCPDLINGVWNFNFNEFKSSLDIIHKLPWCPICNENKENPKIELPWA